MKTPVESSASKVQATLCFSSAGEFRRWLLKHHATHPGIWLKLAKKGNDRASITYAEALDEALCYGWIDGQKKPFDELDWLQKFTRRGPRSVWSKVNVGNVERLTREARMQPAGQAAVDAAKADGRWERAYHSSSTAEMPADFLEALARQPKALAYYETLNKANRYAIFYRLTNAKKPETRAKRLKEFVAMLKRGEKLH